MHVLFVVNNFPFDGRPADGVFNLRQLQAMRSHGIDISVVRVAPAGASWMKSRQQYRTLPETYTVDGIPVRVVRGLLGPKNLGIGTLPLQLGAALRSESARMRADIVHAHGLLPAALLATAIDLPRVITAHGSEAYRLPWMRSDLQSAARKAIRRADGVAAVSDFVGGHLRELGANDVRIIYNGADTSTFAARPRAAARRNQELDPQRPVIAFAGHLMTEKGVHELLEAAAMLRDLNPIVVLAGSGPLRDLLAARAQTLGVDFRFRGQLPQDALAELYAASDIVTLPSYAEGLPTAICEAMMTQRAVVASAVGGIPEIVRDGCTGYVVPPRDARALSEALRKLLENTTLRERFEQNAGAFAREHLTWDANVEAYLSLYAALETKKRSHPRSKVVGGVTRGLLTGRKSPS